LRYLSSSKSIPLPNRPVLVSMNEERAALTTETHSNYAEFMLKDCIAKSLSSSTI
jgi:hypothetical protein